MNPLKPSLDTQAQFARISGGSKEAGRSEEVGEVEPVKQVPGIAEHSE